MIPVPARKGVARDRRIRRRDHRRTSTRPARTRHPDQAGELVQLLTPEGERIDHPDYPLGDADIRGMYRDMVLVRRIDAEATALQRQGELGIWACCSARRPHRSAPAARSARRTWCSRPTANTAWPTAAASTRWLLELFRGVDQGGWDPERTTSASTRS